MAMLKFCKILGKILLLAKVAFSAWNQTNGSHFDRGQHEDKGQRHFCYNQLLDLVHYLAYWFLSILICNINWNG